MTPMRLQRSRAAGSRLGDENGLGPGGLEIVCVTRPGIWGNPFRDDEFGLDLCLALYRNAVMCTWSPSLVAHLSDELAKEAYRLHFGWRGTFGLKRRGHPLDAARVELAGKHLACWCALPADGEPDLCHAAILLELANGVPSHA